MPYPPDITLYITLGTATMIVLVGVIYFCKDLRRCRRDLNNRINTLRIGKMLDHAGIDRTRYLCKANPLTIEKHLLVCNQCGKTDICDECLLHGKGIPEYMFCRNYRELIQYR